MFSTIHAFCGSSLFCCLASHVFCSLFAGTVGIEISKYCETVGIVCTTFENTRLSGYCRYGCLEILYYPRNRWFSVKTYPIGSVPVGYDMSQIPVPGTYLSYGGYVRAMLDSQNMSCLTFFMVGRTSGTNNCFSPDPHEIGTRLPTTCPAYEQLQSRLYILGFLGDELVRFRSDSVGIFVNVTLSLIFELNSWRLLSG